MASSDDCRPGARKRPRRDEDNNNNNNDTLSSPKRVAVSPSAVPLSRLVLLNKSSLPRPDNSPFCMTTALCQNMDVLLNVVKYLSPRTLVYVFSISAPFHYMMNSHFTTFILSCTKGLAAGAEWYFPWRCYRELCIDDPALRRPQMPNRTVVFMDRLTGRRRTSDEYRDQSGAAKANTSAPYTAVPSLRWLKMVTYREIVVREIVAWLAVRGHRTPVKPTIDALKRMWFLLDVPMNIPRIALIHNSTYFSDAVLGVLTMFFLKLDMSYTDPVCFSGGEVVMREMLLGERTLTTMWNFLRGEDGHTRLRALKMWVRHAYRRPGRVLPETQGLQRANDEREKMPIMGIPARLVGRWGYEIWGMGKFKLLRPDELVLREHIRRQLDIQKHWLRMMRWGFLDNNLQTMPVVKAEDVVFSLVQRKRNERSRARDAAWTAEKEEATHGNKIETSAIKVEAGIAENVDSCMT